MARSAVAMLAEMHTLFCQERLEAHEFARRFGTITYDSQAEPEVRQPGQLSFRPHHPAFQTTLEAQIEADEQWEVWSVDLFPASNELITLADLEPVFGPARISDPTMDLVELHFRWEPPGAGPVHCRLFAMVHYLDLVAGSDDRMRVLEPSPEHRNIHLTSFELTRGRVEDAGGMLSYPRGKPPRPATPARVTRTEAQR